MSMNFGVRLFAPLLPDQVGLITALSLYNSMDETAGHPVIEALAKLRPVATTYFQFEVDNQGRELAEPDEYELSIYTDTQGQQYFNGYFSVNARRFSTFPVLISALTPFIQATAEEQAIAWTQYEENRGYGPYGDLHRAEVFYIQSAAEGQPTVVKKDLNIDIRFDLQGASFRADS
ncbi:hypothetical protein LUCX_206 [Xanthomonas phage vB_XciM_LucasX]|nr:hypothetical protein LUCX_206 [Xanthomonas phage vB_XciM_LucasX]